MTALAGPIAAMRFLTAIPVPGPHAALREAVRWSPAVGLILGLAAASVLWLAGPLGPLLAASLAVAVLATASGFLHLDGLADSADGLLSPRSPAVRREIMRDPRTGSFGVAAIVLIVLLKCAALASLSAVGLPGALIAACCASRWAIVLQGAVFRVAPESLLGAEWREGSRGWPLVAATSIALAGCAAAAGWTGLVQLGISAGVALGVGALAAPALEGLTGDVNGASVELAEVASLIAAVALARVFA